MRPVPLAEAAVQLGISEAAVRHYVNHGVLQAYKSDDGQWLVYRLGEMDPGENSSCHFGPTGDLIETLEEHIACLERELADLKAELCRRDRIIASLTSHHGHAKHPIPRT